MTVSTYDYTCTALVVGNQNMGVRHWWNVEGNTELLEVKPATVPFQPPQMQHRPAWDRKPVPSP
jgi:hypothetical protein